MSRSFLLWVTFWALPQQTTVIGDLALQRFAPHSSPCSFPASTCISLLVHPKVTRVVVSFNSDGQPSSGVPSHGNPSESFPCPAVHYPQFRMCFLVYIFVTTPKPDSKSTFSFRKMPFKKQEDLLTSQFEMNASINCSKASIMQKYVYECFIVCSCETAIFQWIPYFPVWGQIKTF